MKSLNHDQQDAANVASDFFLKFARALYWHSGAGKGDVRGGSSFILRFERGYVCVTANHVMDWYLEDLNKVPGLLCQLSNARIFPERTLISQNTALDIATFELNQKEVDESGAEVLDCIGIWPPPEVPKNDSISLTGYPEEIRHEFAKGHLDLAAWGAHAIVEDVNEREIVIIYDPNQIQTKPGTQLPELGYNLSGCSGGPVVLSKNIRGLIRWFPVGLIMRGPLGKGEGEFANFDVVRVRRLSFLQPDGSIEAPNNDWLPGPR